VVTPGAATDATKTTVGDRTITMKEIAAAEALSARRSDSERWRRQKMGREGKTVRYRAA
jgi:hypothetical protein